MSAATELMFSSCFPLHIINLYRDKTAAEVFHVNCVSALNTDRRACEAPLRPHCVSLLSVKVGNLFRAADCHVTMLWFVTASYFPALSSARLPVHHTRRSPLLECILETLSFTNS